MLPDLSALPPEVQQQIQQIEQQARQQVEQLQQTITIDAVMQMLRDQRLRPFILEVETDSTIEPDQMAEKQTRTEFMSALGPMLQQAVQAMQAAPQMAPLVAESIRFVVSGFKVPRSMDDVIDQMAEKLENYQPPQQEQNPQAEALAQAAQAKSQAEVAKAQAAGVKAQADAQKAQADTAAMQQQMQIDASAAANKQRETDGRLALMAAQVEKIHAEIGMRASEARTSEAVARQGMDLAERGAALERTKSDGA